MQRPVMNPTYFDDAKPRAAPKGWAARLAIVKRVLKLAARLLLVRPLAFRQQTLRIEVGSPIGRFVRGAMYRLAFVPLVVAGMALVLVYAATHPPHQRVEMDPSSQRIYFEPVTMHSEDGKRITGWLVPVLDAERILVEREQALRRRHAAVVLVHDYGATQEQMLPLIRPLHEADLIVMAVALRGSGQSDPAPHTFGLKESQDVRAAVEMLRRRPFVDPDRIAVLGIGSGATAAMLAARSDPAIAALVVENPVRTIEDVLVDRLGPRQEWLRWLDPLCKWSFEIAYQVNTDDIRLDGLTRALASRPVMVLDQADGAHGLLHPQSLEQVRSFLGVTLLDEAPAIAGMGQE